MKRMLLFVAVVATMFTTTPVLTVFADTSSCAAVSPLDGPSLPPIEPNFAVAMTNTYNPDGPSLPPIEPN